MHAVGDQVTVAVRGGWGSTPRRVKGIVHHATFNGCTVLLETNNWWYGSHKAAVAVNAPQPA